MAAEPMTFVVPVTPTAKRTPFCRGSDGIGEAELAVLHASYFDIIHPTMPFLREDRFRSELSNEPNRLTVICLSYAVALMGSAMSPAHRQLQSICYKLARKYVELCEQEDEEELVSLNIFQSLILIVRYELTHPRLVKAWMTIGRAVRLSKMLGLHCMDGPPNGNRNGIRLSQAPLRHQVDIEERRRSFWTLYILEIYVRTRTGAPCELGDASVCVL